MDGLILHKGSKEATLAEVLAVPVPEATDTYKPVSYGLAIDFLRAAIGEQLQMPIKKERYGLNTEGKQLFAMMVLDTGDEAFGLSIGLRQSYNKSLALGVAVGANVFVCDNLAFSGDAFRVVRKNTVFVWRDFQVLVADQVKKSLGHFDGMKADIEAMRETPCSERNGFAWLGVAVGQDLLTPHQASVAFEDWKKPRYDDFSPRTIWSLYNCITEGLKKGPAGLMIDRHVGAHSFMMDIVRGQA